MTARVLAVVLALTLTACAIEPSPYLAQPAAPMPNLRGTWRGTWAGVPVTLVVIEHSAATAQGGVYLGPWPLTGPLLETFSGVFTFPSNGAPLTVNVQGRFGDLEGQLAFVVDALTRDVRQLVLSPVAENRLVGAGKSDLEWEPLGSIELTRVTR